MSFPTTLIQAAAILDGAGNAHAPGVIALRGDRIIATGAPESIGPLADARHIDLPHAVVIPTLVNAHAHLDLSHLDPAPSPASFTSWVSDLRARRCTTERDIADAVSRGVALSLAGGTAAIGDIAGIGSLAAVDALRQSQLEGTSYVEVFGLGENQAAAIEFIGSLVRSRDPDADGVRLGVQPHAPYSCGPEVYRAATDTGLPLSTHLAETLEELIFLDTATGPIADVIRSFGAWNDGIRGAGAHPLDHLAPSLAAHPFVCAHLNYVKDRHIGLMAQWPVTVAYCPRASAYFGHPAEGHDAHQYRRMIEAGVNVALGTDGLLCLDTPDRISVLDEMRLLHRRDWTPPETLMRMGTINGAVALDLEPARFTLDPGPVAGLLTVDLPEGHDASDPIAAMMNSDAAPRWIVWPDIDPEAIDHP